MSNEKKVFCIIPAYNEEETIGEVVREVKPLVDEVVVVDDGSQDQTAVLARTAGATVLRHLLNRGQGAALATGNKYALSRGAEIIVHFDADGQFRAEEISAMVAPIVRGEAEIVFGSRFLEKKSNLPWAKKNIILPLARLVNFVFLGIRLSDPQSGFRVLSSSAAQQIDITQDRMAHCSEIMSQAFRLKLRIKEVPITVFYRDFGQRFSGGLRILRDLFLGRILNN